MFSPPELSTHRHCSRILARTGLAVGFCLAALGCSAENAETNYPDDTQFGPADVEISDVEVEDGTEDGLDLDGQ